MVTASSFDMKSMTYPFNVLENNDNNDPSKSFISAKERNPWYSIDFEEELNFDNVISIWFFILCYVVLLQF